jgi:hypothetical protein
MHSTPIRDHSSNHIDSSSLVHEEGEDTIRSHAVNMLRVSPAMDEGEITFEEILSPDQRQARLIADPSVDLDSVLDAWSNEAKEAAAAEVVVVSLQEEMEACSPRLQERRKSTSWDDASDDEDEEPTVPCKLPGEQQIRELSAQDMYWIVLQDLIALRSEIVNR